MIGERVSHYKIIEKLGEGGMGEVYKAEDTKLKRTIALKFLPVSFVSDEEAKKRFIHEAQSASVLEHSNICTIHEIGETERGQLFISMSCYDGNTLKEKIKKEKLNLNQVIDISLQISEGLKKAHNNKIFHRDIKPANIFITNDGVVKILDFGLAKAQGQSQLTQIGTTVGTISYMSPEQARGEIVDQRTDIWSLGVVIYEMLTGIPPFNADYDQAIIYSILNDNPDLSDIPAEFQPIIRKALARSPNDRYQNIEGMIAGLENVKNELNGIKQFRLRSNWFKQFRFKFKWVFAVVLLIIFALIIINYVDIGKSKDELQATQGLAKLSPEKSVAVMYFENIPDPDDKDHTGEMLTNLLITSLSQIEGIEVISRERLLGIQKDLGQTDTKDLSPSFAEKVANQANVNTMLIGSILQKKPKLAVTTRLIDVQSGKIIKSCQVTNFSDNQIFSLVDSLTYLLRNNFQVASVSSSKLKPVSDISTSSSEAYRAYIEGVDLFNKNYHANARAAFSRAVELDSNFAMAYNWLSFLTANPQKSWELFQKAVKLVDRTTECEKLYILANNYRRHDNPSKAVEMLEKLIRRYPHEIRAYELLAYSYKNQLLLPHKGAEALELGIKTNPSAKHLMNNLAYFYVFLDQKQKALDIVNQYIKMAPAEPNPYDTKGDIYSIFLQHDSSIASYRKAFELRSDFANGLGFYAVSRSRYKEAEKYFEITRYKNPVIEIHKGEILKAINKIKAILISSGDSLSAFYKMIPLYYEVGSYSEMLHISNELSVMLKKDPGDKFYGRTYVVWSLVKNGKSKEADKLIRELKKSTGNTPMQKVIINYLTAVIAYEKGDYNTALNNFTEVFEAVPPKHWPSIYYAVTLLKTGNVSGSIDIFKQITKWPPLYGISILGIIPESFEHWAILVVKAHYWLGVAYEKNGQIQKAIDEYKKFLDIWKNADFNSPELSNAKIRIAKLTRRNNTDITLKQ